MAWIACLLCAFTGSFRSRESLQIENLALRHQLAVYHRTCRRPMLRPGDRILWSWLARVWLGWREALMIVRPATAIAWRRRKFREHWTRLSCSGERGRPTVSREVRNLIRRMSSGNPLWGAPHIVGEPRMIGIDLAKATVEKYLVRRRRQPSPTWRVFLRNHVKEIIAIDFFIAARSPWQNPFVERLIGSIRRECLDHVIVVNERHLKGVLRDYFSYYQHWRTHQALEMDCPEPRPVQRADRGRVVEVADLGGLHHYYERAAA